MEGVAVEDTDGTAAAAAEEAVADAQRRRRWQQWWSTRQRKGMVVCRSSLMPFSDQAGGVACVVEGLGNRDFLRWQAESGFFIERSGGVELVAEARRGAPGEETCPGGAAVGARHVACGKAHAILCD